MLWVSIFRDGARLKMDRFYDRALNGVHFTASLEEGMLIRPVRCLGSTDAEGNSSLRPGRKGRLPWTL